MFSALKEARARTVSLSDKRGMDLVRFAISQGLAAGEVGAAEKIADQRWGKDSANFCLTTKATVAGATTGSTGYGAPLVTSAAAIEFFNLVQELSVLGRMQGVRNIPFHTPTLSQYGGATGSWVSEGAAIPMSAFVAERFTGLEPLKVAALAVASKELLAAAEGEEFIRTDLVRACVNAVDQALLDPSNSGVAGNKPASILNGVTETGATSSPIDIEDDFRELIADFGGNLESAYWVFSPTTGGLLHSADHPNVGPRGGTYYGIPVITSRNAASGVVALIDAGSVALATGDLEIETSERGTIEMTDGPTNNSVTPTHTQHVSMFQTNSVAFKITMTANWRLARLNGAAWFGSFTTAGGAIYQR